MREINHLSIHQWLRSAIPDSQQPNSPIGFLFLKLPPPPCAVLLVFEHSAVNVILNASQSKPWTVLDLVILAAQQRLGSLIFGGRDCKFDQNWGFESDQVRPRFRMMMMMMMMVMMMMMMMLTSEVTFKTCQNRQYYSYERDEHLVLEAIL